MSNWPFLIAVVPAEADRRITGPMTLAGLSLLACAITRLSGLDSVGVSFCYFKALTGYACFTCGSTRAFGHLSRFDVTSAFSMQPLITAATLALIGWGALDALLLLSFKRTVVRIQGRASRFILAGGLSLAVLNWVYLLATGV